MKRLSRPLLLALLAGCGDDPPAPAPPLPPAAANVPAGAGLLPADTFLYVEADSAEAVEREAPWLGPLLGFRLRPAIERGRIGMPEGLFDMKAPVAFALAGAGPEECYSIAILPVRDPERAREAVVERGSTAHASGTHVGVAFDARYRPGDAAVATELPEGIVRGRVDPAPLLRSLRNLAGALPLDLEPLFALLGRVERVSFGCTRDGETLRLDVAFAIRDAAMPEQGSVREALSWLPRDASLVVAESIDTGALADALGPLVPILARADPGVEKMLDLWSTLAGGAAVSLSFGSRGMDLVGVANAKEPERFAALYADAIRAQVGVFGGRPAVEPGPDVQVAGVTLHTLYAQPDAGDEEEMGGFSPALAPTVHVFRAAPPPAAAPADWAELDRVAAEEILKAAAPDRFFDVTAVGEYMIVQGGGIRLTGDVSVSGLVEALIAGRREVRIRQAVDPDHPSYDAYRALFDAAGQGAIPPGSRTKRDAEKGEFPDGLLWCPIAEGAEARLPRKFKHRGHFLVALDKVDLSAEDVSWAYVASGRLGDDAQTRDVAYRLRDGAIPKAQAITKGAGKRYVAALIDGKVVAGARLDDLHGACGDFKDLEPATARRLVLALTTRPFLATYASEGEKPASFLWAREHEAMMNRVFGEKGLPIRFGIVGDRVVLVAGVREGLAEDVIARIRDGRAGPLPALAASLGHAPDADFLLRLDLLRFRREFLLLQDAMMSDRHRKELAQYRDEEWFLPGLPQELEPILLAVTCDASGLRLRVRVDGRLLAYAAARGEESRKDLAKFRAESVRSNVGLWQLQNRTQRLPTDEELEGPGPDPWGERYRVEATDDGLRVTSAGPDGLFGTEDDIVAAGEGDADIFDLEEEPDIPVEEPVVPLEEPEPGD